MASLTGASVASSYTSLLKLNGNTDSLVAGNGSNAIQVVDGDGTGSSLYLNTDNIGIGMSPSSRLSIKANGDSSAVLDIHGRSSDDFAIVSFKENASQTVKGQIKVDGSDNMIFRSGPSTDRLTISSAGVVELTSGQLKFPASQNASSDANTLDDYEEGDWSPVVSDGTNNATMHGAIGGRYTKVGNKVTVTAYILVTSLGSVSGAIRVTGLPFAVADSNRNYSAFAVSSCEGLNITAGHSMNLTAWKGTSYAKVWLWDSATGGSEMTGAELSADGGFMISGSYLTT